MENRDYDNHFHFINNDGNNNINFAISKWNSSCSSLNSCTFRKEFEVLRIKAKEMVSKKSDPRKEFKDKVSRACSKDIYQPTPSISNFNLINSSSTQLLSLVLNKAKMNINFDALSDVDIEIAKLTMPIEQCIHLLQDSITPEQVISEIYKKALDVKNEVQEYLKKLYSLALSRFGTPTTKEYILATCIQASHWYFTDEICFNIPSYHPFSDESQFLEVVLQRFESISFERFFDDDTKKWTFHENTLRVMDTVKNRKIVGGILISSDGEKMLLVRPRKQRFFLDQKWYFPKGKVEIDEEENLIYSAKAEILEEAGVNLSDRDAIGVLRFDNQVYFIFEQISEVQYRTHSPYEIDKVAWFQIPPDGSLELLTNLTRVNSILEGKHPPKKDFSKYKEERNLIISSLEKDYQVNISPIQMIIEIVRALVSWKKKRSKRLKKLSSSKNNTSAYFNNEIDE